MMNAMRYDEPALASLRKAHPGPRNLGAVCPRSGPVPLDAASHFARRALLVRGLMAGSLDAADAVLLTRPAVELLGLLMPIDGLTERYLSGRKPAGLNVRAPDFEHCRRELLAVVAAMLDRWLGEDPGLWLGTVARAGGWQGTLPELIESVAGYEDRGQPEQALGRSGADGRAPRWPRGVDASAVLLAMAPPGVVERFLEGCEWHAATRGFVVRMLDRGPLLPALVDYAMSGAHATPEMFDAYVRNPAFLAAGLRARVLGSPQDVEALQEAYFDDAADRTLRIGCVRRAEAAGGFPSAFLERLLHYDYVPHMEPLLASRDPQLVHLLLKRITHRVSTPALRWAGYATLASVAGLEPVWALEKERVGRLDKMAEPVRVSMTTGEIAPILAAADAAPLTIGAPGTRMELGAPEIEPWPYTDLIREHVETNPRRQRAVGLLRASVSHAPWN